MMDQNLDHGMGRRAAAFCVHVFTALGAGLGLLALLAAVDKRWAEMFAWLMLALVVDGIDGALARRFDVRNLAARWSGDTLDLVVDILTWVFVPAYAIVAAGLLPAPLAVPLGVAIVVTSALYFADGEMKMSGHYFQGFPGAWNVVAFFLLLLRPNPWVNAAIVAGLCVLTFVKLPFLHPFRVERGRFITILLLAIGGALAMIALLHDLDPGPYVTVSLCAIGLYFLGAGLFGRAKNP